MNVAYSLNAENLYLGETISLLYPSLDSLTAIIVKKGPGALLFKTDLKRAYRQIFVDPGDMHLLAFKWKDKIYVDRTLPFGLRSAAYICQRVTNMIRFLLKERGIDIVNYIDDLGGADTPNVAHHSFNVLRQTLSDIGAEENMKKACPPSTKMVFLGTLLDSEKMEMRVTDERMFEIRSILPNWLSKKSATRRQLQSLLGKLQFVGKCVAPSRVFISRILVLLRGLKYNNHKVRLTAEFRKDIQWWMNFIQIYNGVSMIKTMDWSKVDQIFSTDACLTGCGALCNNNFFHREFPDFVKQINLSIVHLECLAIMVAIKYWYCSWHGYKITIYCDNEAVCHVINSGKTKDSVLLNCLREITYVACINEFQLRAVHLSSKENRLSDLLSRWHLNENNERLFYTESGLSPHDEIFIGDHLFKFENQW